MIDAVALRKLSTLSLSPEQMAGVLDIIAGMSEAEEARKAAQRARTARYRERLDVSPSEWERLRATIFDRDGFICRYCAATDGPFDVDHVVPVSLGGNSDPANLVVACRSCNASKGGRTVEEWRP